MNEYEEIRQKAEEQKQKVLENYFQPKIEKAFNDLCKWLPNRKITLHFGMGTFILDVEKKNTHSASFIWDNYGSINDSESMKTNMPNNFLNTPLFILVELLDNCYCSQGYCLALDSMEYTP